LENQFKILKMKFHFRCILALAFSIAFVSCSKHSDSSSTAIVGTWTGSRYTDNVPTREDLGVLTYSFNIKADSTITTQGLSNDGNTYYYNGTWSLNGSLFKATVNGAGGVQLLLTAVYSNNSTLSSGRWANVNGSASGGFEMKKSN
jgi:hypothetical protein